MTKIHKSMVPDLASWLALRCQKASVSLSEITSSIAFQLGHGAEPQSLVGRANVVASALEETAAKIRQDVARAIALSENKDASNE